MGVQVTVGPSDGRFTEITGGELQAGMAVIHGKPRKPVMSTLSTPAEALLLRVTGGDESIWAGTGRLPRPARNRSHHPGGGVRGHHGAFRFRQVHRDEYSRLPRHTHGRIVFVPGSPRRATFPLGKGPCCGATTLVSSFRDSTFWPGPRRWRTSSCPCFIGGHLSRIRRQTAQAALASVGLTGWEKHAPARAVRRAATTRGHRPGHRHPSGPAVGRRTDRKPRHPAQPRNHGTLGGTQ